METKELKQYTGTKTVKAMPMTLGEAEQVLNRHIDTSAVENRDKVPGYLVEYGEDGDNYRSWSPKEVFERAYRPSETYLDRMLIEYDQLKDRIMKLQAFVLTIGTENAGNNPMIHPMLSSFDSELERALLNSQLNKMQDYAKNLGDRIRLARGKQKADELAKAVLNCKLQARFTKQDCGCVPCPPHQEQDANTQDLTGGGPTPLI